MRARPNGGHNRPALRAATMAIAIALVAGCRNRPPDDTKSYVEEIASARARKDATFKNGSEPVPENQKVELLPLAYFPVDPSYSVPAILRPSTDRATLQMPTSTGGQRQMRRVGTLEFALKSQPLRLTAFVEVGSPNLDHLFVPFTDLTSGTETYPGGRYLDLDRNATGVYLVDFNRAYHPYCYYNPSYECPYPPEENRLQIPIRSGERLKKEEVKR